MKTKSVIHGEEYVYSQTVRTLGGQNVILCRNRRGEMFAVKEEEWNRADSSSALVTHASTKEEKIRLFVSMFQGREGVFAKRFISRRTGKAGYGTACRNNGVYGICDHRIRCADCGSRSFYAFDAASAEAHLKGRKEDESDVCGIYPIRRDHTVSFLAIDFDEENWKDDVNSIRQACEMNGIMPAAERSRSGKGAHIWFFFAEPVLAREARRFGSGLLTFTMEKLRHQLPFSSYDRLIPSQDYVPENGFGNLIALPFQGKAVKNGNTLFVDERFVPYADQWAFLSSVEKISREKLEELISRFGSEPAEEIMTDDRKPWVRNRRILSSSDFPSEVMLYYADLVYVPKAGFSESALTAIKRLAAFGNPEYRIRQKRRQSVYGVPRIIDCSYEDDRLIGLPRGCLDRLQHLLGSGNCSWQISDERTDGTSFRVRFKGTLRADQKKAADEMLKHETGILEAQPSFGKTVVGAYLIAERKTGTLVLVHTAALLSQWKERLEEFLIIDESLPQEPVRRGRKRKQQIIGQIGQQKKIRHGFVDVAIYSSLFEDDGMGKTVAPYVSDYGMVIVDECHHVAAETYERVLRTVKARYVYGLSATPRRGDGHHPIEFMQCGPLRFQQKMGEVIARRDFPHLIIPRFTVFRAPEDDFPSIMNRLSHHEGRNRMIAEDAEALIRQGKNILILTERKEHASLFAEILKDKVNHMFLLLGSDSSKEKKEKLHCLGSIGKEESVAVCATGRYVGEGFDLPRLDTLLLAMPVSGESVVLQYVGRVIREAEGKNEIRVYDYADIHTPMLDRMFRKRLRIYKKLGMRLQYSDPAEKISSVIAKEKAAEQFIAELAQCSKSAVVFCRNVSEKWRDGFLKAVRSAVQNGARCECRMDDGSAFAERLQEAGAAFRFRNNSGCFAVLENEIVWYGGEEFLSEEQEAIRIVSADAASELLELKKDREFEQIALFG